MKPEWEMIEIGERTYTFSIIPPEHAVKLWAHIVDVFGVTMSNAIPIWMEMEKATIEDISDACTRSITALDAEKVKPIIDVLIGYTMVTESLSGKGEKCNYDHFHGKILELYKVAFYCARYNYWDFFSVLLPSSTPVTGQE